MNTLKISAKSFFSLFAIMRITSMQTRNPLSIILFIALFYIFSKMQNNKFLGYIKTTEPIYASILSILFSAFTLSAKYQTLLNGMTSTLFCMIILLLSGVGFFIIYYHFVLWIFQISDSLHITSELYSSNWIAYLSGIVCFICWLPYFLHQYPGVMTPDSINQYAQIIGAYELSNHHPIAHTAIIAFFYNLGLSFTGDVYFGIALYTIAQMLFMSFTAGYVVRTLQKAGIITPILIAVTCFYALMPYNAAFSVTIWKDIPFAGAMTLFCAALFRLLTHTDCEQNKTKFFINEYFTLILPYIISGILLCLLRTNGWYVFLLTLPLILFIYRKKLIVIIPVNLLILFIVLFIKYPFMNVYEIKQADFVESLSIPVQQIARVIANNETISDTEIEYIEKIMDTSKVPQLYQPDVSDNIKNLIRQTGSKYLEENKSDFFKIWLSIGLQHPKTYFDAYVAQTNGYWFPDISYEVGLAEGIYPNEFGLSWQPILRGNIVIKIKEIIFKLPDLIPLYGGFWSMGLIFWAILISIAICFSSHKAVNALVAFPAIALILTLCIATPVATEFRYAYALFYGLPLFLLAPFAASKQG